MSKLYLLHFNDVYRVAPQKISPTSSETIDVTQFGALVDDIRQTWPKREDGKRDGLLLFSGDVFSPSVESSVTRGSHMVPVMNELGPDVSLTGNHDFDFGYPHLSKLIGDTTFPWLLSNIIDTTISKVPDHLHEFQVLERGGIRIGIIGLVEKEWIGTVSSWPSNFEYRDMVESGLKLSERLRDPSGEYNCDLIIALTHARVPNDIALGRGLLALSPAAQQRTSTASSQGVDLILGGHDHLYFVSKGVNSWINYDTSQEVLGAEQDNGDVLVVKSGTDFRDLSELTLEFADTMPGSIRKKVIKNIQGRRHTIRPDFKSSVTLTKLISTLLKSVSSTTKVAVCNTAVELDLRSQFIRTEESAAGNWFADICRHTYDDALCMQGYGGGSDGVFICAGTLRGDSVYGPGKITLGDILEILPFEDPLVVLELDGEAIWDALESSLETWPAQEGRFPVISGFRLSWDSRRPPGQRVLGVWLVQELANSEYGHEGAETPDYGPANPLVDSEFIKREHGRKYKIVTREYMAQGHDGFLALKGQKYLVDDESGQLVSSIVRKYLMGSQFINKMVRLVNQSTTKHLHRDTTEVIIREQVRREKASKVSHSDKAQRWKHAAGLIGHWVRSKAHYQDQLSVSAKEHMSTVDCFDGAKARYGKSCDVTNAGPNEDLITVHPMIDGRLKDEAKHYNV